MFRLYKILYYRITTPTRNARDTEKAGGLGPPEIKFINPA